MRNWLIQVCAGDMVSRYFEYLLDKVQRQSLSIRLRYLMINYGGHSRQKGQAFTKRPSNDAMLSDVY